MNQRARCVGDRQLISFTSYHPDRLTHTHTQWWLGLVAARWSRSTKLLYARRIYYHGMGDHLQVGKPPQFVISHSGQLSLLPSAWRKLVLATVWWHSAAGEWRQIWFIPLVDKCLGGR